MKNKNIKGFTLVELLATIGIIAVLSAAVFPFVSNYRAWAQQTSADRSAKLIYDAVNRYNALTDGAQLSSATSNASVASALVGSGSMATTTGGVINKFLTKAPSGFALVGSGNTLTVTFTQGSFTGNAP